MARAMLKGRRQQRVWDANVLGQRSTTYGVYDLATLTAGEACLIA